LNLAVTLHHIAPANTAQWSQQHITLLNYQYDVKSLFSRYSPNRKHHISSKA
jgi:hypothetical protein